MKAAPVAGVLIGAGLGALFTYCEYVDAIASHAWTGASVVLGIGLFLTLAGAAAGWFAGALARRSTAAGALCALLALFLGWKIVGAHRHRAYLFGLRSEVLAPERAAALFAGPADERAAIARNPTCPPDLLVKLGRDPESLVRWGVSINHRAPKAILDELTHDADPSVRYNAAHTAEYAPAKP
jgi:hypothetical protein